MIGHKLRVLHSQQHSSTANSSADAHDIISHAPLAGTSRALFQTLLQAAEGIAGVYGGTAMPVRNVPASESCDQSQEVSY